MLLKGLSDRIFFVLNKVDAAKFCTGATVDECRKSVAERITKAMDIPGFALKAEQANIELSQLLDVTA